MPWLHAVVDVPADQHDAAGSFWQQVLGWPLGEPWYGHPELASFEPPDGTPYVHLQRIDGPARVHVDVETDDRDAGTERAVALGARFVAEHERWTAFVSPGGLPFCLVGPVEHAAPEPLTWPGGGHRSRLVQVCVDSPPPVHDAEVAFWRALLPGRWADSPAPEFAGTWHDDGSPLQLLFQRTGDADGPTRAHLDLGTDDLPAEVGRLRGLGAADVGPGRGWHVLRDPTGSLFCATENSPATTRTREIG